jgi:hypothetical protein
MQMRSKNNTFQLSQSKHRNITSFFFEYEVIDGRLVRVFWADTTSRKNYAHFGDVLSFDTTYSTNQYDLKIAPFTGVNHHIRSIFSVLLF